MKALNWVNCMKHWDNRQIMKAIFTHMIFRLTPSWQLTWVLIAGLMGLVVEHVTSQFLIEVMTALCLLWGIGWLYRKEDLMRVFLVAVVMLIAFWLGVWRMTTATPAYNSVAFLPQEEIVLQGDVIDLQPREDYTRLVLTNIQYGHEKRVDRVTLTMRQAVTDWQVGDRMLFSCRASIPENVSYRHYLEAQDIYLTCSTNDDPVHLGRAVTPQAIAWRLRANFEQVVNARFSEPYATLLIGLYIGDVSFSQQWQDIFKITGISHIVAASGSNVSLTVLIVLGFLAAIGVRRQDSFWWLLFAILGFVVISGMSAPVVRAGVMGAMVLLGRVLGRGASMRNALLLTLCVMLLIKPLWLFYDIGFQLSVASTWGLLYLSNFFKRVFYAVPETLGLQEAISTTSAAFVATTPILILSFGQLSVLAPIANLLILPALPYTMFTGVFALILPAHPITIALPWLGLEWMLRMAELIGSLSIGLLAFDNIIVKIVFAISFICLNFVIYFKGQQWWRY